MEDIVVTETALCIPGRLFAGLDASALEFAMFVLRPRTEVFEKGAQIPAPGEEAAGRIAVLQSGLLQCERYNPCGKPAFLGFFEPGAVLFAEAAFSRPPVRDAVLFTAVRPGALVSFPCDAFLYGEGLPPKTRDRIRENLYTVFVGETLRLIRLADVLNNYTARDKILAYLRGAAARGGSRSVNIGMRLGDFARLLAVCKQALSTELGKMEREGLIARRGREFVLLGE